MSLEHIENRHFAVGERIQLDGKYFVGCTFDRCEVIYGGGETSWEGVNWSNCHFSLLGAANFTVQVLKALGSTIGPPWANPELAAFSLRPWGNAHCRRCSPENEGANFPWRALCAGLFPSLTQVHQHPRAIDERNRLSDLPQLDFWTGSQNCQSSAERSPPHVQ